MRSRELLAVITVVLSLTAALLVAEVAARVAGYRPRVLVLHPEPRIHQPDPVLGWRALPGRGVFGPYVSGGDVATVTIRPDGARTTGPVVPGARPQILLVGCSFTLGWAVSDDETFAWRLQTHRPDIEVQNYGETGYGTVQSLLLLKQLLAAGNRPVWVLYGGNDFHDVRNIATPSWLKMIGSNSTRPVKTPYATLDADGHVQLHPPVGYPSLFLHEHSALVALLEGAWSQLRSIPTDEEAQLITEGLIEEMAATAHEHGAGFSAVLLTGSDYAVRRRDVFLEARDVDVIDCRQAINPWDRVFGEGHPNADGHRSWGDCIAAAMADRLPRRQ
jgi:lysophospholipase L1-like esterase